MLASHLAAAQLEKYLDAFTALGVTDIAGLKALTDTDLDQVGLSTAEKARLRGQYDNVEVPNNGPNDAVIPVAEANDAGNPEKAHPAAATSVVKNRGCTGQFIFATVALVLSILLMLGAVGVSLGTYFPLVCPMLSGYYDGGYGYYSSGYAGYARSYGYGYSSGGHGGRPHCHSCCIIIGLTVAYILCGLQLILVAVQGGVSSCWCRKAPCAKLQIAGWLVCVAALVTVVAGGWQTGVAGYNNSAIGLIWVCAGAVLGFASSLLFYIHTHQTRSFERTVICPSANNMLASHLAAVQLEKYLDAFTALGVTDIAGLKTLTDTDLDQVGLSTAEKTRLRGQYDNVEVPNNGPNDAVILVAEANDAGNPEKAHPAAATSVVKNRGCTGQFIFATVALVLSILLMLGAVGVSLGTYFTRVYRVEWVIFGVYLYGLQLVLVAVQGGVSSCCCRKAPCAKLQIAGWLVYMAALVIADLGVAINGMIWVCAGAVLGFVSSLLFYIHTHQTRSFEGVVTNRGCTGQFIFAIVAFVLSILLLVVYVGVFLGTLYDYRLYVGRAWFGLCASVVSVALVAVHGGVSSCCCRKAPCGKLQIAGWLVFTGTLMSVGVWAPFWSFSVADILVCALLVFGVVSSLLFYIHTHQSQPAPTSQRCD